MLAPALPVAPSSMSSVVAAHTDSELTFAFGDLVRAEFCAGRTRGQKDFAPCWLEGRVISVAQGGSSFDFRWVDGTVSRGVHQDTGGIGEAVTWLTRHGNPIRQIVKVSSTNAASEAVKPRTVIGEVWAWLDGTCNKPGLDCDEATGLKKRWRGPSDCKRAKGADEKASARSPVCSTVASDGLHGAQVESAQSSTFSNSAAALAEPNAVLKRLLGTQMESAESPTTANPAAAAAEHGALWKALLGAQMETAPSSAITGLVATPAETNANLKEMPGAQLESAPSSTTANPMAAAAEHSAMWKGLLGAQLESAPSSARAGLLATPVEPSDVSARGANVESAAHSSSVASPVVTPPEPSDVSAGASFDRRCPIAVLRSELDQMKDEFSLWKASPKKVAGLDMKNNPARREVQKATTSQAKQVKLPLSRRLQAHLEQTTMRNELLSVGAA